MIVLFTDFGRDGPYVGQMHAAVRAVTPDATIIDLMHDAPVSNPRLAAYLLAAYVGPMAGAKVFVCVVDPGVGGARAPVALNADGIWYVGPDNGLLAVVARRAADAAWHDIAWRPAVMSATFHGRDLFAPVAAQIATGTLTELRPRDGGAVGEDWPDDLAAVCQIDRFGNVITGTRAAMVDRDAVVTVGGKRLRYARTFGEVPTGEPLWTENANGLLELAVNQGRADVVLGLGLGDGIVVG